MGELDKLIWQSLIDLRNAIIKNIQSTGSNASGKTIRSLVVEKEVNNFTLVGRSYFGSIETGRRSGRPTPIGVILEWINAKGIGGSEKENLSFAYAISKTHAKKGSSLHRKGGRTDIYTNEIESFKQKLYKDFASKLELIIVDYVNRNK